MRALLLAVALAAAAAAGAAARPAVTFEPSGAHLALELPRGWRATPPDRGWRFEAVGPGSSGWVFLSVVRAVVTDGSFQRSLIAFERGQARRLGSHVTFRTKRATVAGERAVEVYAAGKESNAQLVYGFRSRPRVHPRIRDHDLADSLGAAGLRRLARHRPLPRLIHFTHLGQRARRRSALCSSASGITRTSASTGMKFVSPTQRARRGGAGGR